MSYNLSFMDNTTSIMGIAEGVNDASGGWLFGLLLIFFYILFFMVFSDFDTKNVFLADSFIITIIAGALFGAGFINGVILGIPAALFVISIIVKVWGE